MIIHATQIRLHHTDALGVMFYGNLFPIIHESFETFIEAMGGNFEKFFSEGEFLSPVVHAEADYKALELKAEEAYRKNKEEADKTRKIYYVFRKAIAQLGGMVAETPAKPAPAPEPKSNAG